VLDITGGIMKICLKAMISFVLIYCFAIPVRSEDPDQHSVIQTFKHAVESQDKEEIAKLVKYPLSRKYPVPPIADSDDFYDRFDEVFDEELCRIITSAALEEDWHEMGWRGMMLKNGLVWLDSEGKVTAINHESAAEQIRRDNIIKSIRQKLHSSLQDFVEPVLEWKTKNYRIRIDLVGEGNYRYASWPVDCSPGQKPALIVTQGEMIPEGTGGNHHFDFCRGIYTYRCVSYRIGMEETPPGELEVLKNGKRMLCERVTEIIQP
jgi:hypothetical protein